MGAMQRLWSFLGFIEEDQQDTQPEPDEPRRRRAPVFSLHTSRATEIVVLEPRSLEEARSVADHLRSRCPVIVNLRDLDREAARRIVDFICGAAYAVDGQTQRVGEEIFLFTPSTVTVTAESVRDDFRSLFPTG